MKPLLTALIASILIFTGCREPQWRKFHMIEPGYGFKFIEKATQRETDSLVWWSIAFRFTNSSDSLIASASVLMDIEPLAQPPGKFDLRHILAHCVPGDSLVIQYNPQALSHQPFYNALEGAQTGSDSLVRMHVRVLDALNAETYEAKRTRERMTMYTQALESFKTMVMLNENLGSSVHVPITTFVSEVRKGKGTAAKPGDDLDIHFSIITSYGRTVANTDGHNPVTVRVMGGDFPRGLDMALAGLQAGGEYNIYIPFTENSGSRLLGAQIWEFDNLRAGITVIAVKSNSEE